MPVGSHGCASSSLDRKFYSRGNHTPGSNRLQLTGSAAQARYSIIEHTNEGV